MQFSIVYMMPFCCGGFTPLKEIRTADSKLHRQGYFMMSEGGLSGLEHMQI